MAASVQCMYCRIVVGSKKSRKKGCSCTQFYPPKPYRGGFLKRGAVVVSDERRRRGHGEPTFIFSIFKTNTELAEKIFGQPNLTDYNKITTLCHNKQKITSLVYFFGF